MNTQASILVVDDEPTNFDVIETLLASENYQLHYASSGQRVLDRLERFDPDVILMDVMMPDLDGIEVCRQIRAKSKWEYVPILIVTALTSKADLSRAIAAGADDFISKPLSKLELKARIHSLLRIKRQHDLLTGNVKRQESTINLLQNSLQDLRGNVIRALPHELNTPLHGMLGLVDLLIDSHPTMSSEEIQEALRYCKQSALRMERLTQKFLAYVQLQLVSCDEERLTALRLGQYSTAVKDILAVTAIGKAQEVNRKQDLQLRIEPAIVTLIREDLKLMLEELLDNAFKFSKLGTPVQVMGKTQPGQFLLSVSNQGRSLSPDQVDRIGSFMQFDRQQYEQQGVGLGLAIVKEILTIYGGTLSVNSAPETGTRIQILLPTHP